MTATWPCPAPDGTAEEFALAFDHGRARRVLVIPAMFDEGNRLRRFTVEALREVDRLGIDVFLPDLPGTNESLQPLAAQTIAGWRAAIAAAATHFRATHVLAIRGGALVAPELPGVAYAPAAGASTLRQLLRIRMLSAREMGREESTDALLARGRADGLELAGYRIGAEMIRELQAATPVPLPVIAQAEMGGPGLWLRAEPGEDAAQSAVLARLIAERLAS